MNDSMRKPMYSPAQVRTATFFGGPLAGTHLLWSNFMAMSESRPARLTIAIGLAVTVAMLAIGLAEAPIRHPLLAVPLLLCLAYDGAAGLYQLKKEAIATSTEYRFQSNWKVAGIGLAWLMITLALSLIVVLILAAAGIDIPG